MQLVRFGNVAALLNKERDKANDLRAPNNRVVMNPDKGTTYVITGHEDIETVDNLIQSRGHFIGKQDQAMANEVNNSLYRFLLMKAFNLTTKISENTVKAMLEVM